MNLLRACFLTIFLQETRAADYAPDQQPSQPPQHFDGFDLPQTAKRLHIYFERLSRDELGVKAMQAAQANLQYTPTIVDPGRDLDEVRTLGSGSWAP